jgi:hypothetical protein
MYRSNAFRSGVAHAYMRHFTAEELAHLAETFQHPVFRKYRQVAPQLFLELAAIEREMFAQSVSTQPYERR